FDRMFERDKDELRELGIPLVTEPFDAFFDDEPGYRIDRREYALPDISFASDELAVLGLASRAWTHATLAGPAAQALRKLEASGVKRDDSSLIGIVPMVRTVEPAFEAVKSAVLRHTAVAFTYRTASTAKVATRHVQPWAIASWHGHWYLTGFDTDRQAPRVFRLGRIEGEVAVDGRPGSYDVPENHQPTTMIRTVAADLTPRPATLEVRVGTGHSLRRQASAVSPVPDTSQAGDTVQAGDTWSLIVVDFTDTETFGAEICSFGPDVVVRSPAELRESVIRRLTGALGPGPGSDQVNMEEAGR
ncbi:MAG: WYL domain-containing protein, partial [Actinomycetota bacterium]